MECDVVPHHKSEKPVFSCPPQGNARWTNANESRRGIDASLASKSDQTNAQLRETQRMDELGFVFERVHKIIVDTYSFITNASRTKSQ